MALRVTVVNPEGDENMFLVASSTEVEDLKVIRPYIDRVYFFFFFWVWWRSATSILPF